MAVATRKDDRLELRLEPERRQLLDEAASATGMSTSAFVLAHATEAAQEVLADRVSFVLPPDRWDAFVQLLDRDDERPIDSLASFLTGPSVTELE